MKNKEGKIASTYALKLSTHSASVFLGYDNYHTITSLWYPYTNKNTAPLFLHTRKSIKMNKVIVFALLALFASSNAFAPSTIRSALARPNSCVFAEVRYDLIFL